MGQDIPSSGWNGADDPFTLDREIFRAVSAWRAWRRALFEDPASRADDDVFLLPAHRRVATKSLFDALAEKPEPAGLLTSALREGGAGDFKAAMRRWVAFLLQARNTRDADVALARARATASPPREDLPSYRDAWRAAVAETARGKSMAAFDAAAERGPELAPLHNPCNARRHEVLRRPCLEGEMVPEALAPAKIAPLAKALLDATGDLWQSLLHEERKREGAALLHPADAVRLAMSRTAREGWPARLSSRWTRELFSGWLAGVVHIDIEPEPRALGGASFVRALEAFGRGFRAATFDASRPFALRQDPHFIDQHRVGALLGSLAASQVFHRRALGLGKDAALAQSRALGKTLLFGLRLAASRVLLANQPDPGTWDEVTAALFGAPAPRSLAGAWPAPQDDQAARLFGWATVQPLMAEMIGRFDEDWFANPRAAEAMRTRTLHPARTSVDAPEQAPPPSATDVGRTFEELFG